VIFRKLQVTHLPGIDRIWRMFHKGGFGIPNRNHLVTQGVVEKDGTVVAYGMVKQFAEAILVLDLDESTKAKVEAIRILMEVAIMDSTKQGVEQLHVFVQDPAFAEILKKHFGFVPCTGQALVLTL
jgi:hypothetical protein